MKRHKEPKMMLFSEDSLPDQEERCQSSENEKEKFSHFRAGRGLTRYEGCCDLTPLAFYEQLRRECSEAMTQSVDINNGVPLSCVCGGHPILTEVQPYSSRPNDIAFYYTCSVCGKRQEMQETLSTALIDWNRNVQQDLYTPVFLTALELIQVQRLKHSAYLDLIAAHTPGKAHKYEEYEDQGRILIEKLNTYLPFNKKI